MKLSTIESSGTRSRLCSLVIICASITWSRLSLLEHKADAAQRAKDRVRLFDIVIRSIGIHVYSPKPDYEDPRVRQNAQIAKGQNRDIAAL